jgi:hypothetical protein
MPSFAEIRDAHPDLDPAFPVDWARPTMKEIRRIEGKFGVKYPQDFIDFQLKECHTTPMGDFAFDYFGWANAGLGPMENLSGIVADAQEVGVPKELAAFRCDNGDYYCCTREGAVVVWDHNARGIEPDVRYQWPTFLEWLAKSFDDDA